MWGNSKGFKSPSCCELLSKTVTIGSVLRSIALAVHVRLVLRLMDLVSSRVMSEFLSPIFIKSGSLHSYLL